MQIDQLKPNVVVRGPILPEPVQIIVTIPMGASVKLVGKGLNTGQVHEPILNAEQLATLEATPEREPFDGDPQRFRLGIEARRLELAYEYDPYSALSIRLTSSWLPTSATSSPCPTFSQEQKPIT